VQRAFKGQDRSHALMLERRIMMSSKAKGAPACYLGVSIKHEAGVPMAGTETLIFRASLGKDVYRDFEIAGTSSLDVLAQAIVRSFDFDFDHAFGFYSNLKGDIYDSPVRYELFVDMGESEGDARSVKRTRIIEAFPSVGTKMRFLFDYGDDWEFLIELVKRKPKEAKVKLPRLLISAGKAPAQYPPEDE
jgi:hypothetical protein